MAVRPIYSGFESDNELFQDMESDLIDIRGDLHLALTHLNNAANKAVSSSDPTAKNMTDQIVGIRESVLSLVRQLTNRF